MSNHGKNKHHIPGQIIAGALPDLRRLAREPRRKSRQEKAYDYVTSIFLRLLKRDKNISYEYKQSITTFYEDMFAHEGVRNNMIQAFSNFLDEIDKRMDASRRAGICSVREAVLLQAAANGTAISPSCGAISGKLDLNPVDVVGLINELLEAEDEPEDVVSDIESMDLSEVGGGEEDDTPILETSFSHERNAR
jgi:hypothetical protein